MAKIWLIPPAALALLLVVGCASTPAQDAAPATESVPPAVDTPAETPEPSPADVETPAGEDDVFHEEPGPEAGPNGDGCYADLTFEQDGYCGIVGYELLDVVATPEGELPEGVTDYSDGQDPDVIAEYEDTVTFTVRATNVSEDEPAEVSWWGDVQYATSDGEAVAADLVSTDGGDVRVRPGQYADVRVIYTIPADSREVVYVQADVTLDGGVFFTGAVS